MKKRNHDSEPCTCNTKEITKGMMIQYIFMDNYNTVHVLYNYIYNILFIIINNRKLLLYIKLRMITQDFKIIFKINNLQLYQINYQYFINHIFL